MKKLPLFLFLFPILLTAGSVSAHSGPPFISVNNVANQPNPAGSGSVFFKVPNELAAQNFVVNETLNFKIDTTLLPVDPSQVDASDFLWEFGNNNTGSGLVPKTKYSKSGSYVIILKVKDPNYQDPIELESMQINILPSKTTQAPKAVIKVNGKTIVDPFKEPVLINKNSTVVLDAGDSEGKIKKYSWDFGDGSKLENGEKVEHKFDFSQPYAYSFFPILRVEDESGVYSDAVVQIASNEASKDGAATPNATNSNQLGFLPYAIGGLVLVVVLAVIFLIFRKRFKPD